MAYRYWMHRLDGRTGSDAIGRRLKARTPEAALSEAAAIWAEGSSAAVGYIVTDTEDGTVVYRQDGGTQQA